MRGPRMWLQAASPGAWPQQRRRASGRGQHAVPGALGAMSAEPSANPLTLRRDKGLGRWWFRYLAGSLGPGGILCPPHARRGEILSNVTSSGWFATWGQDPQNCADETLPRLLSEAFCWRVHNQGLGSVHSRHSGSGARGQTSRSGWAALRRPLFLECGRRLLTTSSGVIPCVCLGPNRLLLKGHRSD